MIRSIIPSQIPYEGSQMRKKGRTQTVPAIGNFRASPSPDDENKPGAEGKEATDALSGQENLRETLEGSESLLRSFFDSNAFKHAFRGKKQGLLDVSAKQVDGHIHIVVRDDGSGIPENVDVYRTTSLGLKLIRSLVKQLNGTVMIMSSHGTEVTVEFPLRPGGT